MRKLSVIVLVVALILGARSQLVWNSCGYDCGIISTDAGITATEAWFLAVALVIVSAGIWITAVIRDRKSRKRENGASAPDPNLALPRMSFEAIEQRIRTASRARICTIFRVSDSALGDQDRFGVDLDSSFQSYFRYNELDQVLHDIRDVANKSVLAEINSGRREISTVLEYCNHMVLCYETEPDEVEAVIGKVSP